MTPTTKRGLACAVAAYVLWGGFPIYFKAVAAIPPVEVLAHRIIWTLAMAAIGVIVTGDWMALRLLVARRRRLLQLVATATMLSLNWLTFIWAIGAGHATEAGLGYFICPLMSVLLGALVLRERLSAGQLVGILCVASGVLWQVMAVGEVPWVALILAMTFSLYGLGRKVLALPAVPGLFAETLVMAPLALGYVAWVEATGTGHFINGDWHWRGLLLLAGPISGIPLLLFAAGANRLNLRTLGLLQYLNPTMQLLLAVFLFKEQIQPGQGITFGLIWLGLALYSVLLLMSGNNNSPAKKNA